MATRYEHVGFIGQLIVIPEKRETGIGRRLLTAAIDYLNSFHLRNIYLDGVPRAISLYKQAGFHEICPSLRFMGTIDGRSVPSVRNMTPDDFKDVARLDREAFGSDRSDFLLQRFKRYTYLGKVLEVNHQILGFIMGKARENLVVAGPWIVSPAVEHPQDLFISLGSVVPGIPISLGVLADSRQAVRLLKQLNLYARENPPTRMGLYKKEHLSNPGMCFAVGSPAKG
jgi:ribosomal protein S18 acetylase RimI-like enzyme